MFFVLSLTVLIVGVSSNHASLERREFPPTYQCDHHEHFVTNCDRCQITCTNRVVIGPESICVPVTGCVCKRGYVRLYDNGTGPCISEDECPPDPIWCGPYEVETDCEIICPPQTCDSIYIKYVCEIDKKFCRKGCNCIDGYLRNSMGMCVPRRFCPGPYFIYSHYHNYGSFLYPYLEPPNLYNTLADSSVSEMSASGSHASATTSSTEASSSSQSSTSGCQSAATSSKPATSPTNQNSASVNQSTKISSSTTSSSCAVNSSSKSSSLSVSSNSTTASTNIPKCTKPNEIWHNCPPVCLLENCDDVDCLPTICTKEQICKPRCICIENHYRNASGICIHMDDCPYYEYEF